MIGPEDNISQLSDIDIRLIKVFKAVVDCQGFAAAEVSLNKSKSAISMDMTDLEQRLGMTLCHRGRGGFAVTEQGQIVYEAACILLNDLDQFRHRVSNARANPVGTLTVYVTDNVLLDLNSKHQLIFRKFKKMAPRAFIDVYGATADEIEKAVLDGRADIGIATLFRESTSLQIKQLYEEPLYLYCGRRHALFDREARDITLESLAEHEFIRLQVSRDQRLEDLIEDFRFTASADLLDARVALVLTGHYLGFLPPHVAQYWLEEKQMRAIMPDMIYTMNTFNAMTLKGGDKNPLLKLFLNVVDEEFGRRQSSQEN